MIDCTDADNLISINNVGGRQGFILLALLTKLHFECLKQIKGDDRLKFPKAEEDILFGRIKSEVEGLRDKLLQLDPEHLKLIELALADYKSFGDSSLNKQHLVEFLASSYKAISETISKIEAPEEPVDPPDPLDALDREGQKAKLLKEWKQTIEWFNEDGAIEVSSAKAVLDKVKDYLNVRRNADSLHKIYSTIDSCKEYFETKGSTIDEKRLVLQKILQKVGECIKGTSNTPNLSDDISKSLEEKGIPVKFLADFRDRISHYQIFPLELDGRDITRLLTDGLDPMKQIVRDEVIGIEKGFVQRLVQENAPKIEEENIKEILWSHANEDVIQLINCVEQIKEEKTYSSLSAESKRVVDEIYEKTLQMKSKVLHGADSPKQKPDPGKLEVIKKYIEKNELKVNKKIQDELRSWKPHVNLDQCLDDVAKIEKVVDYLQNGIPSRVKEKAEADSVLKNFLGSTKVLNTITLIDRHTRARIPLHKELEQYFDPQSFRDGTPYSDFGRITKQSLTLVLKSSSGNSDDKKALLKYFENKGSGGGGNSIEPGQYEKQVKGLGLGSKSEEKLLLYLVKWRKRKCIDLLERNPPAIKVIREKIMEGKVTPVQLFRNLAYQYRPESEEKANTETRADSLQQSIESKVKSLYLGEVKKKINVLNALLNTYDVQGKPDTVKMKSDAVQMQFLSVYSLLDRSKKDEGDPFLVRKLRNHLAHEEQSEAFRKQFPQLVKKAVEKIDTSKVVTLSDFNEAFSKAQAQLHLSEMKQFVPTPPKTGAGHISSSFSRSLNLCATNSKSRSRRSIAECLFSKEDVEQFIKGHLDVNDIDAVVIDSEKFLTYVKSGQDKAKNAQLINFIEDKSVEGDYRYLVDGVVQEQGYERYVRNERIKDLYGKILQMNAGSTKTSKLKGRLMNAAGRIQLIRGIHVTAVSCKDGTAPDCGFAVSGLAWSFASQPIENVIVKAAPKAVQSAGHLVGKMIPGTLGRQSQFAIKFVGTKVGSGIAKGVAGAVGGVFDIIDIGMSAKSLIECKNRENSDNPCTEKEIRDEIVSISISGVSFISGVALAAASMPVAGIAVGFALMVGQGVYSGISNIIEYEKKYDTTSDENWSIFWRTVLLQPMADDVQHLAIRDDIVNVQAKAAWKMLNDSPNGVVACAIGLGLDADGILSLRPGYGKTLMNTTDADTTSLSRVRPNTIQNATMLCLPQFEGKIYEQGIKSSVPSAKYYCENTMVIADERRMQNGTTIIYNLESIDRGTIVGSSKLRNHFLIFGGGTAITGGDNTVNRFVFSKSRGFFGCIRGGYNATNIIDLSQSIEQDAVVQLEINHNFYRSGIFTLILKLAGSELLFDYIERNVDTFKYTYVGSKNRQDNVFCKYDFNRTTTNDDRHVSIDSGGGLSKDKRDTVDNCKRVTVSPYTTVTGVENDYTFYMKTTGYKGEDLYSEIDVEGKGIVIFPETNLLNVCSEVVYSSNNRSNALSLKIEAGPDHQYTLEIKNYIDKNSRKPNFILIDKSGSNIIPKIEELGSSSTNINSFELHTEYSLDDFDTVENHYKKIIVNSRGYKIFGIVRKKLRGQSDSAFQGMMFGSSESDIINFDQRSMFARGGNGSDVYIVDNNIKGREITIDNDSADQVLDVLVMPEVPKEFSVQQCDLHFNYNDSRVQIRNYLKESSYRHLVVMNSKGDTFIPYMQVISCVGSSGKSGKLASFLHAKQNQNTFLLTKDFQNNHVVIDSRLEQIERYKDKDDLLLVREGEIPFMIKIQDFYTNQSKWEGVNFLLWDNGDFTPYSSLRQGSDKITAYQNKLESDYEKIVEEYSIDFTKSTSISHNRGSTSTVGGQDEERIGVVILKNIAPSRIGVSSRGADLVFSDEMSNHTINVKGWDDSESYRVSVLEFDLGLEPIVVRRLERFNLSKVAEIQGLINKASEVCQKRDELELHKRLSDAVKDGNFDQIKGIVNQCVSINTQDKDGFTPLHFAATNGNLTAAEDMVKGGANFTIQDRFGRTPLHLAADHGKLEVVQYLRERGANLHVMDKDKRTPLHLASLNNRLAVVQYLVKEGASINDKDEFGNKPLDLAVRRHYTDIEEFLKQTKANISSNETRGGPKQRRRRHHHGVHSYHHLSRKLLSADLYVQPEVAMSGGARPSSWIRGLFDWVNKGTARARNTVGGWLTADTAGFKVDGKEKILKTAVSEVDKDGTILLLDTLIRRVTGKAYISNNIISISEEEAHSYALNITEGFKKTAKQAAENSKISTGRLDVDFIEVEGKIAKKIIRGKLGEISAALHSYADKACPDRKAGSPCRLSQKKFDKFMKEVNRKQDVLLNEPILRMVDGAESNKCFM